MTIEELVVIMFGLPFGIFLILQILIRIIAYLFDKFYISKKMSKATLEFNLPEDGDDFRHAVNGQEYYIALNNIREDVRQIWKYRALPEEQFNLVDEIYKMINERINEANFRG